MTPHHNDTLRFQDVQHMARYGHKDWLCWTDRQGVKRNARKTPQTMKQCLLDSGTTGFWCLVMASSACPMIGFWAMGINILNQMKRGFR